MSHAFLHGSYFVYGVYDVYDVYDVYGVVDVALCRTLFLTANL